MTPSKSECMVNLVVLRRIYKLHVLMDMYVCMFREQINYSYQMYKAQIVV